MSCKRRRFRALPLAVAVVSCLLNCKESPAAEQDTALPEQRIHAFYYPWYGNPKTDGQYANWNHFVALREGPPRQFPGGDDIGANFYPQLGCYSCNDPAVVEEHMRQLVRAKVGVVSVSWWGKDSFTDRALPLLFRSAEKHGVRIAFHIEPHIAAGGRNPAVVKQAISYLLGRYGRSPALFREPRRNHRPLFYIYDSYLTKAEDWKSILAPDGTDTIRGTVDDAVVIGLWVNRDEGPFFLDGHFDGFYTYFASNGFRYGCSWDNWLELAHWARDHGKLFVPCVAPGYNDTRIRPWNGANTRPRDNGKYYDESFRRAIAARPDYIGITSFNEWHEGTQIEPAIPKKAAEYRYEDYADRPPQWYLDRTAYWVKMFQTANQ